MGGRAENPALPQKGEEVKKCCVLFFKKVEHYPLSRYPDQVFRSFPSTRADPNASCLCLGVSLQGVITPKWARAPFLVLDGQGSLEEEGEEGEEAAGGEWRERR